MPSRLSHPFCSSNPTQCPAEASFKGIPSLPCQRLPIWEFYQQHEPLLPCPVRGMQSLLQMRSASSCTTSAQIPSGHSPSKRGAAPSAYATCALLLPYVCNNNTYTMHCNIYGHNVQITPAGHPLILQWPARSKRYAKSFMASTHCNGSQ
jgi:hypothetical protein